MVPGRGGQNHYAAGSTVTHLNLNRASCVYHELHTFNIPVIEMLCNSSRDHFFKRVCCRSHLYSSSGGTSNDGFNQSIKAPLPDGNKGQCSAHLLNPFVFLNCTHLTLGAVLTQQLEIAFQRRRS